MRRFAFGLLALCLAVPGNAAEPPLPPLKREFRGVWIATVANIDWPSTPNLLVEQQKAEFLAILNKCAELRLNAVVLQIRPMCDALYESKLEPWSEYLTGTMGKSPGYDPLAFAVTETHKRGLELHAWFNPYRARHSSAKSEISPHHIIKSRPDIAKPYGTHYWLNPTHPDVQNHSLAVILDVVKRYDIDGIHIDDYFYPYKEKDKDGQIIPFPDEDTWAAYQKAGGKLARDDWRREAVNQFVKQMYTQTKKVKPWVKVGISPFGIWRPGHPPGIVGLDQYAELYADAKLWFNEGWADYYTPQLYWPINQKSQSFPKLLDWWVIENTKNRHLWPGLYTSRVTGSEKGWPAQEIIDQIDQTRKRANVTGVIHFSMKALMHNTGGVADELAKVYTEPALVPETPWLAEGKPLAAPELTLHSAGAKQILDVKTAPSTRFLVVRALVGDSWQMSVHGVAENGVATIPLAQAKRIVVIALDRSGRASELAEVK